MVETEENIELIKKTKSLRKNTYGVVALLLIIIQSCGIRFFSGQGSILAIFIILLSIKGVKRLRKNDYLFFFCIVVFFLFNRMINPSFEISKIVFQLLLIIEAYVFLLSYNYPEDVVLDLKKALKIVFLHSLAGFALYLILPSIFLKIDYSKLTYLTLGHLFYVSYYQGLLRNTGICWEPGLLQLLLNIYLFLCIRSRTGWKLLGMIVLTIISTLSTTGFFILGLNYLYYIYVNIRRRKSVIVLVILTLIALIPLGFIQNNIAEKFAEENTSGLVRYRDYLIGIELIKERPLIGHGNFDAKYLSSKGYVNQIENTIFTSGYLSESGDMSGGYTNGLLGLLCWYGLPLGILCFVFLYKNKIIESDFWGRLLFFLILMLTFISEPITYTSFFLIFPISSFLLKKRSTNHLKRA